MEFIDAWKEGQKLGLTKEEFLTNWKSQSELERLRIEAQMHSSRLQQNTHSDDNNHHLNTKLQALGCDYLEKIKNVENLINHKCQEVQEHITREMNSHKQQLMQQSLTKDEFREQLKSLTDLLSNSMHSISLTMKQKRQEINSKRETEISLVKTSSPEKSNKIGVQEFIISEDADSNPGRKVQMLQQLKESELAHKHRGVAILSEAVSSQLMKEEMKFPEIKTEKNREKFLTPKNNTFCEENSALHQQKESSIHFTGIGPKAMDDVKRVDKPLKESNVHFTGVGAKATDHVKSREEEWSLLEKPLKESSLKFIMPDPKAINGVKQVQTQLKELCLCSTGVGPRAMDNINQAEESLQNAYFTEKGGKANDGVQPVEEEWNLVGNKGRIIKDSTLNPKAQAFSSSCDALSQDETFNGPITGVHANAISLMMARKKEEKSVNIIPETGAVFKINCAQLPASGIDLYSDFYYSRSKPCKVHLRIWFNKTGRLGIHALLSDGTFDKHHKWPITFTGEGYIYNYGSRTFSKLWTIEPQECDMPTENTEIPLGVTVCLFTSRNDYQDVTYSMLDSKHYKSDHGNFRFKWHFKGFENKN